MTEVSEQTAPAILTPPVLELRGKTPKAGHQWCATCCMIYLGVISEDEEIISATQATVNSAIERGAVSVDFPLPDRKDKPLRYAVTTAPSNYFDMPMPVCWVHMVPWGRTDMRRRSGPPQMSTLIPGKAHDYLGRRPV